MKIETLAKNQTVVVEDGKRTLFSYGTPVAQVRDGKMILAPGALDYSVTTSKYIYKFIGLNRKGITDAIKNGVITVEEI